VRVLIVCVGKVRAPFTDDVLHYERLLRRHARLEILEIPEARVVSAQRGRAVEEEGAKILSRLPERSFVCVLDREGTPLASEELADLIDQRRADGRDLCFVVGGPFGLSAGVVARADARISFGRATLAHQLARVVLMEQVFRAHKILSGEPYHY
jgi:23S rRNA (pseudouridine1915-N3)-methyltransferase